jgi:hypothetical protein
MEPRDDVSSTGYALASPGEEYLVLQPIAGGGPFTVRPEPGTYSAEWFGIDKRETVEGGETAIDSATGIALSAPASISGPVTLYLRKVTP